MSKYDSLWSWIAENGRASFSLSFDDIASISGIPIDHSFLSYKKELSAYGYRVGRISMKNRTVDFEKIEI